MTPATSRHRYFKAKRIRSKMRFDRKGDAWRSTEWLNDLPRNPEIGPVLGSGAVVPAGPVAAQIRKEQDPLVAEGTTPLKGICQEAYFS
jgi:hypothetical protein